MVVSLAFMLSLFNLKRKGEFFHQKGEISFRETSGLEVVWGTFFPATKGRIGSVALLETDPLGPTGTRVLIMRLEAGSRKVGEAPQF